MARAVVVTIIGTGPDHTRRTEAPPSFEIRGVGPCSAHALRLDRINSRDLIATARDVYFRWLSGVGSAPEPSGVVLTEPHSSSGDQQRGRVVFELPVLLPDERFIPLELLHTRSILRSRAGRSGLARTSVQPSQ